MRREDATQKLHEGHSPAMHTAQPVMGSRFPCQSAAQAKGFRAASGNLLSLPGPGLHVYLHTQVGRLNDDFTFQPSL